jgi:crotonobetainyl-CoA:carnitine CoA-transferase CaiB-like acyl-CoA transferase
MSDRPLSGVKVVDLYGTPLHPTAAPRPVGANSVAILRELGYGAGRITELARQGIIANAGKLE